MNNAQALLRRADKLEARLLERSSISAASVTEASLHRRQSATGSTARPLSVSVLAAVSPIVEDMPTSSGSCRRKAAAVASEMCLAKQRIVAERHQRTP